MKLLTVSKYFQEQVLEQVQGPEAPCSWRRRFDNPVRIHGAAQPAVLQNGQQNGFWLAEEIRDSLIMYIFTYFTDLTGREF